MEGGVCEGLHGHNYRVAAEIAAPLGESGYVVDFLVAGSVLRAIVAELDHGVLLPTEHPTLQVTAGPEEVEVRWAQRAGSSRGPTAGCCPGQHDGRAIGRVYWPAVAGRFAGRGGGPPQSLRIDSRNRPVSRPFGSGGTSDFPSPSGEMVRARRASVSVACAQSAA